MVTGLGPRLQHLVLAIPICCLLCSGSSAQQSQPSASQTPSQGTNPMQSGLTLFRLLQRKSVVFPDLATSVERLDSWQKFELAANNSVALSTIGAALIGSAYGQATNRPSGYGQGGDGYGKRFGADMARSASDNFFGTFLGFEEMGTLRV